MNKMNIADLVGCGFPQFGVEELAARGITDLEPLQRRAVDAGLFSGRNLVIAAPTSSGKTLVAELAAVFHAVHQTGTVFVTSHKALAYEKYLTFRDSYSRAHRFLFHTSIATGDEVTDESAVDHVPLTVATYEKWYHMLVGRPSLAGQKSLLVIDELQMLGDPHRGDKLEALITFVAMKAPQAQIIGLSATFPNAQEVARWLRADVVSIERRPIPLVEEIWGDGQRLWVDRDNAPTVIANNLMCPDVRTESVVRQVGADGGLPVVVFCVTKDDAERLAHRIAASLQPRPECQNLVNELDEVAESNPTIRILRQILPKGVAFHNRNLDYNERRLIEGAFREGKLDILCATSTLSAGVNLPIRTVVFDSCYRRWMSKYIDRTEYLNMAGRAGRKGFQESGRSVLIARTGAEIERFKEYLSGGAEIVNSALVGGNLDRVILQAIAGGIAKSTPDIRGFFKASFHGFKEALTPDDLKAETAAAVQRLEADQLIKMGPNQRLAPTALGVKVASCGVLPATGAFLFRRLGTASTTFDPTRTDQLERELLLLAAACPDLAPSNDNSALLFVHGQDDLRKLRSHVAELTGLANESDLEDVDRAILSAVVTYRYIQMDSYSQMANLGRYVSAANVRRTAGAFAWMLQAAARIEEARGSRANPAFRRWLSRMAMRLEYGATALAVEILAIARFGDVRGLARSRAERLAQKGFHDLTKLLAADPKELVGCLDSKARVAALREAVVRYLGDSSRHNQIGHANRATTLGRDARLINDFYEAEGTVFNQAALSLLQTVFATARLQDVGDEAEPDLAIPVTDGLLVIECKAKKASGGTIGLHDAFAVLSKSAHLQPVAHVTLGKPAFDQLAVDRAANGGILLVTHVVLCEAILRVWEGTLPSDSLLAGLRKIGLLERDDLDALVPKTE